MPDYDPKSIPILDDIIEDDKVESEKAHADDTPGSENGHDDDTLDLLHPDTEDFSTADINISAFDSESSEPEISNPQISSIDQFIDTSENNTDDIEQVTVESALIDYRAEQVDEPAADLQKGVDELNDVQNREDNVISDDAPTSISANEHSGTHTVQLDEIVDSVVKQLIPDLEQQLRFLVRQALEEKLPTEIIKQLPADSDD